MELPFPDGGEVFGAVPGHPGSVTEPKTQEANGKKTVFNPRLERLTAVDFQKAKDFVNTMKLSYTSTLCVSSERSPTCDQILPILTKLEEVHLKVAEEDTAFTGAVKEKLPMEGLQDIDEDVSDDQEEDKGEKHRAKKSAQEELFEDDGRELLQTTTNEGSAFSITEQVQKEIKIYKGLPSIPTGQVPATWWWMKRDSHIVCSFRHTSVYRQCRC